MLKILIKKELMEINSWMFQNKKTGKIRSKKGIIGFGILMGFLLLTMGVYFFGISMWLVTSFSETEYQWLGFSFMALLAVMLGTFGSVFNTYASVYRSKDKDLLLSMPIPPTALVTSKLLSVYLIGLLYTSIVMIPTLIVWWTQANLGAAGIILSFFVYLLISVFVLVLTCVLGYLVALISSRLKNRSIITVIFSLVFFAVYYYFCFNATKSLQKMIDNAEQVSETFRTKIFPAYAVGRAAEGSLGFFFGTAAVVLLLAALTLYVMSLSYVRIVTMEKGLKKKEYREKKTARRSPAKALLAREGKKLISSANYMLNTCFASFAMVAAAVFLAIKGNVIADKLPEMLGNFPNGEKMIPVLLFAAAALLVSMNDITAPSISLEGKNLWIVRSLPVKTREILHAKIRLHVLVTAVPAAVLVITGAVVLKLGILPAAAVLIAILLLVMLEARTGLDLNLRFPNLDWKNETVPIKQSMPVMVAMFGGWALVLLLTVPAIGLLFFMDGTVYLLIVCAVLAAAALLLERRLMKKGTALFEAL